MMIAPFLRRPALLGLAPLLLVGCVGYRPAPVDPRAAVTQIAVSPANVAELSAHLVPGHATGAAWDRVDLLAAGLLANRAVMAARAAVATADAQAAAARAPLPGQAQLTSEYVRATDGSPPWLLGGALIIPLDVGAPRRVRLAGAGLAATSARYDLAEAVWTMRIAIRRALADRLIALRQQPLIATEVALRSRRLAGLERRRRAGEIDRGEVERARAELADATRRAAEAQLREGQALAGLAAAMGLSLEAVAAQPLAWPDFDAPTPLDAVPDSAALLVGRADVLRAVVNYDTAENNLRGQVGARWPSLNLQPGFSWDQGITKLPFGIGLNLPPLDLNRRNIRAAEAARAEAGKRLDAAVAAGVNALQMAEGEARVARAALDRVRREDLPIAERLARQSDTIFRLGGIDRPELITAQAGLITARLAELDALARVHAADAALEDALRRPLEGPERDAKWQGVTL